MNYIIFIALLLLVPILYLKFIKKNSIEEIKKDLLPHNKSIKQELFGSIKLFIILVLSFILIATTISIVEMGTGITINDMEKVSDFVNTQFNYNSIFFIFLIIIVLFVEELFFRAFLTPRIGIILSTLIFTFFHLGYESISETIGVFILGLILAYWFKKNKSIIQNYIGHLLYDILAIVLYVLAG